MARCSQNGENLTTLDLEFRARKQSIPGPRTGTTLLGHIARVTGLAGEERGEEINHRRPGMEGDLECLARSSYY
jgi:hypothetical protein